MCTIAQQQNGGGGEQGYGFSRRLQKLIWSYHCII